MDLTVQLNTSISSDIISLYDVRCGSLDGLHVGYLVLPCVKNVSLDDQYLIVSTQNIVDKSVKEKVLDETKIELHYRLPKLRIFKLEHEVIMFMRFKQANKIIGFLT